MKKLTVLVDMDDVLVNTLEAWVWWLNRAFYSDVFPDDITDWDISRSYPYAPVELLYEPLKNPEFWETVRPVPGAREGLLKLYKGGYRVSVVTASWYDTLQPKMDRALFKWFPELSWRDVVVTHYKQGVRGDVLIDDNIDNLTDGNYAKLLMDAPHNRNKQVDDDIIRVKNWPEIIRKINEIAMEE